MGKITQLKTPFDATKVKPLGAGGQLPVGKHKVQIIDSEILATRAGDGAYIRFTLEIVDGPLIGTTGFYNINIENPNEKAVAMGQRQLSSLCHVTGVYNVQDSRQLHGISFMVEVKPQADDKYTEVTGVFDIDGNRPGQKAENTAAPNNQAEAKEEEKPPASNWADAKTEAPSKPSWVKK